MYLIALTGGIASGKSVVAQRLREHGAVIVDADALAREVVQPGAPALEVIAREFGAAVITAEGALDRQALGAIVFADAAKRASLNAITHPAIRRRAQELFDAAAAADRNAVVVYDVPLLAEASDDRALQFDLVVVVQASVQTRLTRLVELRGMTQAEAQQRIDSQASDEARLALADAVIDSEGVLEHTLRQVDELWEMVVSSVRTSAASAQSD